MSPTFVSAALITALAGCAGQQPALLLQCNLLTRARATGEALQRRHEVTFSASVALPFERAIAVQPPPDDREPAPLIPDCDPHSDPLCAWAQLAERLAWTQASLREAPR